MSKNEKLCFEIVSFKFIEEIGLDHQIELMKKIDRIVQGHPGFISREYFYSHEKKQWIDKVIWKDWKTAHEGAKNIMNDTEALLVFEKIDQNSMAISHYEKMGPN